METAAPMRWGAEPSLCLSLAKQLKSSCSITAPEHLLLLTLTEVPGDLSGLKRLERVPQKPELGSAMSPFRLYSLVVFITPTSERFLNAGERPHHLAGEEPMRGEQMVGSR